VLISLLFAVGYGIAIAPCFIGHGPMSLTPRASISANRDATGQIKTIALKK
jgi:hypothetical protein